ncbi:zinc finger protein 37-like isoform X2 [Anopheles stephensi]|uniref:zinc finger protein 37-like isoform X2 n=1 Tax=Anopheles stephensi TaxID=30069 RepID=UPI001658792E|nr:zinc finger protein 37-like isoform X2 [Anopheles stephensi]
MASFSREINNVCRLCLDENEAALLPTSKVINSTLTVDNIERFTGIRVLEENVSYVICQNCHNKLRKFAAYRAFCMNNDVRFRELYLAIGEHVSKDHKATQETPAVQPAEVSCSAKEQCENENDFTIMYVESTFDDHVVEVDGAKVNEHDDEPDEDVVEIIVQTDSQSYHTKRERSQTSDSERDSQNDEPEESDSEENDKKSIRKQLEPRTALRQQPEQNEKNVSSDSQRRGDGAARKYERKQQFSKSSTIHKQLCSICGKLVQYLPDHIVSHTKEQKYSCEHCPMTCSRKSYLKLHVEAVHMKKVVKSCKICNRDFTHITGYTAHMRAQHNVGDWYECTICNQKFRHPGGLRGHNNRKHNADSNCECPICGMKFQDKKGLKDHSRVHSNEKPFACSFCPKRFKSPNAHRTHMLIHKGVVFSCTLCEKTYRYKSLLNTHMKKFHAPESLQSEELN